MKRVQWIFVAVGVGAIAAFLGFDGPLRVSNWLHRGKTISETPPSENRWAADPAVSALAEKIGALTIERTGCFGACPVYVFRLERGRKAYYEGKEYVSQIGRYTGSQFRYDHFNSLAYFAAARLLPTKDRRVIGAIDLPTVTVTIEMTDGSKRIFDAVGAAPNDLLLFCTALDGSKFSIDWIPEKTANQEPEPTPGGVAHY